MARRLLHSLGIGVGLLTLAVSCGRIGVVRTAATAGPSPSRSPAAALRAGPLSLAALHAAEPSNDTMRSLGFVATAADGVDDSAVAHVGGAGLQQRYQVAGFLYRHTRDYVRVGFSADRPSSWFPGTSALVHVTYDELPSTGAADDATAATLTDLDASGYHPVTGTSTARQLHKAGDAVVTTAVVQRRGTTVVSVTGACNGCADGALPADLQPVVDAVIAALDHLLATPPSDTDRITAFLATFSQQLRSGDVEGLVGELNPVVITRYGRQDCLAHANDLRAPVLKDPTASARSQDGGVRSRPLRLGDRRHDDHRPQHLQPRRRHRGGRCDTDQTIHLNVANGVVTWFLDCGTPRPIGG